LLGSVSELFHFRPVNSPEQRLSRREVTVKGADAGLLRNIVQACTRAVRDELIGLVETGIS
jgi:hypothetical protein